MSHFHAFHGWAVAVVAGASSAASYSARAAMTGLRQGELLALRWRAVDRAGGFDATFVRSGGT